MEFGPVPVSQALGAVLAHSQATPQGRVRKGRILTADDIAALSAAGLHSVVVARPGPEDCPEDQAAAQLAGAIVPSPAAAGLRVTDASTGRVNLYATGPGVLVLDVAAIETANALDPMVTIATLPAYARTAPGAMVATIKIISYAVPQDVVNAACDLARSAIRVAPVCLRTACLILTEMMPGDGGGKGQAAVATRLDRMGMRLAETQVVAHETDAIARAVRASTADLVLLLTASATSDPADVGPAGLVAAGGVMTRFGMPVDPGNLLFSGTLNGRAVIGLPGCARSPALNGADWVLERTVCGLPPSHAEIAAMGIGGLLKESPARPHPRAG